MRDDFGRIVSTLAYYWFVGCLAGCLPCVEGLTDPADIEKTQTIRWRHVLVAAITLVRAGDDDDDDDDTI